MRTRPARSRKLERIIATNLLNPTRSCVATWFGLLGEMFLVAGAPDEAADALDRGDACLDAHGQRYSEALLLLIRARLLQAQGEPPESVREVADRARALAEDRGAHLFARRADALLAALAS